jgi:hypothetical protein
MSSSITLQRDTAIQSAQNVIRMALSVLAAAPAVDHVTFEVQYDDYNDEFHTKSEWVMNFVGTHIDRDLDEVPGVRRLEKTFAGGGALGEMIYEHNTEGCGLEEAVVLEVHRDWASLDLSDEEGETQNWIDRRITWDIVGGTLSAPRQFYLVTHTRPISAHALLRMHAEPATAINDLDIGDLDIDESWLTEATAINIERADQDETGTHFVIEIAPSASVLRLGPNSLL